MAEERTAQATLRMDMIFDVTTGTGHSITLDAGEEHSGDNHGARPVELLLAALAGCTGMDVISILRKKRQEVTGYTLEVRGEQADEHPRVYTTITIEHSVTGHAVDPRAVARAIELSATRYCPTEAMLGRTATITNTFTVRAAEDGAVVERGVATQVVPGQVSPPASAPPSAHQ